MIPKQASQFGVYSLFISNNKQLRRIECLYLNNINTDCFVVHTYSLVRLFLFERISFVLTEFTFSPSLNDLLFPQQIIRVHSAVPLPNY